MESVMNRATARGQSLTEALNSTAYFPPRTQRIGKQPITDAGEHAAYQAMFDSVMAGSNTNRLATGNASGTVGFGEKEKLPGFHTSDAGGERFGLESGPKDKAWHDAMVASIAGQMDVAMLPPAPFAEGGTVVPDIALPRRPASSKPASEALATSPIREHINSWATNIANYAHSTYDVLGSETAKAAGAAAAAKSFGESYGASLGLDAGAAMEARRVTGNLSSAKDKAISEVLHSTVTPAAAQTFGISEQAANLPIDVAQSILLPGGARHIGPLAGHAQTAYGVAKSVKEYLAGEPQEVQGTGKVKINIPESQVGNIGALLKPIPIERQTQMEPASTM
jgi:hypothetical protein